MIHILQPIRQARNRNETKTNETYQAQNNIYFSLNTICDQSAAGWGGVMQWDIQQAEAIPVKIQAFDSQSIFNRGECCPGVR